jgi:hypothetical protein
VLVLSDDPEQPRFPLTMSGELLVDFAAIPPMLNIGEVRVGKPSSAILKLRRRHDSPAQVVAMDIENTEKFTIQPIEPESDAPDAEDPLISRYEIRYSGDDQPGDASTRLTIRTSGEHTPMLSVPIRARTVYNLRYVKSIRFTRRKGRIQQRQVHISSRDGDAPKIRRVEDPDGLLDVEVLPAKGPMVSVRVQIKPEVWDATAEKKQLAVHPLYIHTDDAEEPRLELDYRVMSGGVARGAAARRAPPTPGKSSGPENPAKAGKRRP